MPSGPEEVYLLSLLMSEVCKDVNIESNLLPIDNQEFNGKRTSVQKNGRLNTSERGLWKNLDKIFFDVRITYPLAALST